jgi:hypothetical protein
MNANEEMPKKIDKVISQQLELKEIIQEDKKKDNWDKFQTVSTFISTVIIAIAGIVVTWSIDSQAIEYQKRTHENELEVMKEQFKQEYIIKQLETFQRFIPHLMLDKNEREIAMIAISASGQPELTIKLEQIFKKWEFSESPKQGKSVANAIMSSSIVSKKFEDTDKSFVEKKVSSTYNGWIYLGDYNSSTQKWDTKYLNFSDGAAPTSLINKEFQIRPETGSLNVRINMPTESGYFLDVIDELESGRKVVIVEIKPWSSTGYTWAKVTYK